MGLAICKDMHFAPLGHAYGAAGAQTMLVPAWDFQLDAWMGARMTVVRGVENGYAVLRAAREGVLTVSDAYGRVLAERASSAMPGSTLLAPLPAHASVSTWAGWLGPLFGWLCVALGLILLCAGRRAAAAAAVILPKDYDNPELNDSKKLSEKKRYALREQIKHDALAWAVGIVTPEEIDKI